MICRAIFGMCAGTLLFGIGSMVAVGAEPPKTTTEQDIVYTKAGSVGAQARPGAAGGR